MMMLIWGTPVTFYVNSKPYVFDAELYRVEHQGILDQLTAIGYGLAEEVTE